MQFQFPIKRNIVFDEPNHIYTDEVGTAYISVTTLIKKYELEFEREYWLEIKAKQLEVSTDDLSNEWNRITKEACDKGTKEHKYLEDNVNSFYSGSTNIIKKKPISFYRGMKVVNLEVLNNSELKITHYKVYLFLVDLINQGYTLYSEKRVYNSEVGICGTIDIFAVKGDDFIIVDWKTNKDTLCFKSGYFKKNYLGQKTNIFVNQDKTFKYPLHNIPFCKGETYTLQLSLYAFLSELFGMTCKGLYLWHLRQDDVMYKINYRKEDVNRMIEHYYKNK